jgi:hypothetical protein
MSRIIVKDLSTTMEDAVAGSTQVFSKTDSSGGYEGVYMKRGTNSEKLIGNPAVDSQGIIRYNAQTISQTTTIPVNVNAFSAGPLTIGSGYTITIGTGSYWTII